MQLNIDKIDFGYSDDTTVIHDASLLLDGSQFVCILGPNGVGKSTLIHCINKILEPTEGAVLIDDVDVTEISLKEMAKIVGYVPVTSSDSFPLTVVDTVMMGRHPHSNWKTEERDLDIVYEALKRLEIGHLAMRRFNELSAGQHQKVALARGLVQEPKILLLDEPTSNLDIRHQLEVTKMLKALSSEKGIQIIMICHDINIAARFADRIVLMCEGTIYDVGTPEEMITEDNIRKVYGVDSSVIMDCGRPHVLIRDSVRVVE